MPCEDAPILRGPSDAHWLEFFQSRGGAKGDREHTPLVSNCPDRKDCWKSFEESARTDYCVPRPYVGRRYAEGRVIAFGQNLYDWGGWRALELCVDGEASKPTVRWHQAQGRRRETGLGKVAYRTNFWDFAIAYLTVLTNASGVTKVKYPLSNLVASSETWDLVAFSEVVKCSPWVVREANGRKTGRSDPSGEMFTLCPERFARDEASSLEPSATTGLVLGLSAARALAAAQGSSVEGSRPFLRWTSGTTRFFGVVHPAAWGGSRRALIQDFEKVVAEAGVRPSG